MILLPYHESFLLPIFLVDGQCFCFVLFWIRYLITLVRKVASTKDSIYYTYNNTFFFSQMRPQPSLSLILHIYNKELTMLLGSKY